MLCRKYLLDYWWVASWNISKSIYIKSLSKIKNKIPSSKHLFSQSSSGFCSFLLHWWNMFLHCWWESESSWWPCLRVHTLYIITTRPVKFVWWPMWVEKLALRSFSSLNSPSQSMPCWPPEPIKCNVVIAFKWLKNLILWCWYVQRNGWWRRLCR